MSRKEQYPYLIELFNSTEKITPTWSFDEQQAYSIHATYTTVKVKKELKHILYHIEAQAERIEELEDERETAIAIDHTVERQDSTITRLREVVKEFDLIIARFTVYHDSNVGQLTHILAAAAVRTSFALAAAAKGESDG